MESAELASRAVQSMDMPLNFQPVALFVGLWGDFSPNAKQRSAEHGTAAHWKAEYSIARHRKAKQSKEQDCNVMPLNFQPVGS